MRRLLPVLVATLIAPSALLAQKPAQKPAPSLQPAPRTSVAPTGQPAAPALSRERLAAVDAHADATPDSVAQSVAALAAYLATAGSDDLTRARALFRWIAGNIEYDAVGFRTGDHGDQSAEAVLRSRSSVCEGYARLAEALGAAMGLEVQRVSGWSKGYGYTTGQRFDGPTNHAWNAVRIDGQWRLMDPTWGAGYLDQQTRFVRRFQEHYFLTSPDAFIFDHFPQDPRWQLLERPVTAEEYVDLAFLRPAFFSVGFRIGSHPRARIAAADRIAITLGATHPVQMSAQVLDATTSRPLEGEFGFVQVAGGEAQIQAAFPRAGDFLIRVFAKPQGGEGSLDWVMDYRVTASRGTSDAAFPMAFTGFGARGAWLVEPLGGLLQAGRSYRFRLRAPGALDVAVVANGVWTHLTRSGEEWAGDATAAAGNVVVFAKYDPSSDFTGLLRYTGR